MNRPFCAARWRKQQQQRGTTFPQSIFFCMVGLHGKAGAQARRTRAETRRRREAYPLWYSDRRQRRMCLRPSVRGPALSAHTDRFFLLKRKEDVRLRGCASRASRSVFLSRKKRKDPPGARSAFCRPCGRKAGSSRAQTAPQWETRTRSRRANGRSRTARTPQGPAPRADG